VEMGLVYLVRRRKNYRKAGELELTPPSERMHEPEQEEPVAKERKPRSRGRRSRGSRTTKRSTSATDGGN